MSVLNWIFKSVATLLWPHCVADADILFYPSGFFFLSFFLAYSQQSQIACLPYFHTWCGLSANLECRSEMCCTRLAENTGRKITQKVAICSPSHNFIGLYLHNWSICRQSEKNLLTNNISSTRSHDMVNIGPLTAEIGVGVWGTPANFSEFRLGFITAPTSRNGSQPNFAQCLAVSWVGTLYTFLRSLAL